jgi:phage-related protein
VGGENEEDFWSHFEVVQINFGGGFLCGTGEGLSRQLENW